MSNQILFSQLEADVHPFEWVSALLSEYKSLRKQSGVDHEDPDAESIMLSRVKALVDSAQNLWTEMSLQPEPEYSSGDQLLDELHANAPTPYDP